MYLRRGGDFAKIPRDTRDDHYFWWRACCKDGPDMISLWQNPIPFVLSTPILTYFTVPNMCFHRPIKRCFFRIMISCLKIFVVQCQVAKNQSSWWKSLGMHASHKKKSYKNRAPLERGYHIPSWGPCVFDHMVKFTSCNVQKKGTLLDYHNFHPDFSVWIDPWENKNHQQVEVGKTLLNVPWSKQIADLSVDLYYTSYKLYIYMYMEFHFFVILDLHIFIDLCRSQRQFQNPKHLGVEEMTPVDDPSPEVACDVETFLGTWMVQCEPPQLLFVVEQKPQ